MYFANVVCIAEDEHSVEVLSLDLIKYSLTNKINRRTAVVLASKIENNWHIVEHGSPTGCVLPPEMAMITNYCVECYVKLDGENKRKICSDIKKITSQDLELEDQRQTNAFVGGAWR